MNIGIGIGIGFRQTLGGGEDIPPPDFLFENAVAFLFEDGVQYEFEN